MTPTPPHPLQSPMKMERSRPFPACGSPKLWIPRALGTSTSCPSKSGLWKEQTGEEGFATEGSGRPCRPVTGLCPGRVVVTLNPQLNAQWEVAPEKGEDLELSAENLCDLREPEPSPFSSKRTMYETEEVRSRPSESLRSHLVAVGQGDKTTCRAR